MSDSASFPENFNHAKATHTHTCIHTHVFMKSLCFSPLLDGDKFFMLIHAVKDCAS